MLKFRGRYRVLYETDVRTGKVCELTYIPCRIVKGSNICRHNDNTLNVLISGAKIASHLLKEYPDIFKPFQMCYGEATLLFPESMIEEAAGILKPYIQGANKSPRPKRKHEISEEQRKVLLDKMKSINETKSLSEKKHAG